MRVYPGWAQFGLCFRRQDDPHMGPSDGGFVSQTRGPLRLGAVYCLFTYILSARVRLRRRYATPVGHWDHTTLDRHKGNDAWPADGGAHRAQQPCLDVRILSGWPLHGEWSGRSRDPSMERREAVRPMRHASYDEPGCHKVRSRGLASLGCFRRQHTRDLGHSKSRQTYCCVPFSENCWGRLLGNPARGRQHVHVCRRRWDSVLPASPQCSTQGTTPVEPASAGIRRCDWNCG
mmetsp:Transcript_19731/g.48449  ORF Transcript_19731/g.48449 Transcript_19731/m.48449 type:complete len:233 (+) Transcript_19731:441-1139(+)